MTKSDALSIDVPPECGWRDAAGKLYLHRCPSCRLENYRPNVPLGLCTWCGWTEAEPWDHREDAQ